MAGFFSGKSFNYVPDGIWGPGPASGGGLLCPTVLFLYTGHAELFFHCLSDVAEILAKAGRRGKALPELSLFPSGYRGSIFMRDFYGELCKL